jgi:hypothetical protein
MCDASLLAKLKVANQGDVSEREPRFETWGVLFPCGIRRFGG